jgi:hypothetical protein
MYDVISATNSSPQTTEINASIRADSLMKWVHLGLAQGVAFAILGSILEPKHRTAPLVGAGLAGGLMYMQYLHAMQAGLESNAPCTERPGGFG